MDCARTTAGAAGDGRPHHLELARLLLLTGAGGSRATYPESSAAELRRDLGRFHGIDAARIVVGHGAEEVLTLLLRAHLGPGDGLVVPEHAFCW